MEKPRPLSVHMTGVVFATAEVRTVGDLRELIQWCDEYDVRDEAQLDWGTGQVYIDIIDNGTAEWIEDGDSMPPNRHWDVLVHQS
jgi:hypothetical protein